MYYFFLLLLFFHKKISERAVLYTMTISSFFLFHTFFIVFVNHTAKWAKRGKMSNLAGTQSVFWWWLHDSPKIKWTFFKISSYNSSSIFQGDKLFIFNCNLEYNNVILTQSAKKTMMTLREYIVTNWSKSRGRKWKKVTLNDKKREREGEKEREKERKRERDCWRWKLRA